MNEIDVERIKSRFYAKLKEETNLKTKKTKLTSIVLVAAIVCLTGATVFAANLGIFVALLSRDNYSADERLTKAKQSALENSLIAFDKIDDASVILDLDNGKNVASIMLTVSDKIDAVEMESIIRFIAKSVENLEYENIQITDQDANIIYPIE